MGAYVTDPPHRVGSIREVHMSGTTFRETILAWDEPSRWAYRVDESSAPAGHALVEDWVLEDPAGKSVEQVRPIRDEIDRRVLALLAELTSDANATT